MDNEQVMAKDCRSTHLINGDGLLNVDGLESFMKPVKMTDPGGLSFAVVAIMGPQSSGKSTLLNHLFSTNFVEMEAEKGRNQTTLGIWMAEAVDIEPFTIVLDLEGNDGQERGQNKAFEKKTALFALALADVVLINMWENDIGREDGANKPLLTTVFQAMIKLFPPRKTTLLFVIRDKSKRVPIELLEATLRKGLQKIWEEEVTKPESGKESALSDFFTVQVTGLCNYAEKEEQFKEEVAELRKRFYNSIAPNGIAGDRQGVVPWSGFSYSAQHIWKVIVEDKDLDLPSHKVMVATLRCEEIAHEKLRLFLANENWLEMEAAAKAGPVSDFGEQLSSILHTILSEYEKEAMYFDQGVRVAKRQQLESKLLQIVYPTYETLLGHLLSQATQRFKNQVNKVLHTGEEHKASAVRDCQDSCMLEFDKQCADVVVQQAVEWNIASVVREKLWRAIDEYSSSLCSQELSDIVASCKKKLLEAIESPTEDLLIAGDGASWPSIRTLLRTQTDALASQFLDSVSSFELDHSTCHDMLESLKDYARCLVVDKARDTANSEVGRYMTERFEDTFNRDGNSMRRRWDGDEDITGIAGGARTASLKLLSVMAAIRLDERFDDIERCLFLSCLTPGFSGDGDLLTSTLWNGVPSEDTILTPVQCKNIWNNFLSATEETIEEARTTQDINRRARAQPAPVRAEPAPGPSLLDLINGVPSLPSLLVDTVFKLIRR